MSLYRLTASLLNSWLRATDPEAGEKEYNDFYDSLNRIYHKPGPAAQTGIDFEDDVESVSEWLNRQMDGQAPLLKSGEQSATAVYQFAQKVKGGLYQMSCKKITRIHGMYVELYGICDFVKAGVIYDIKRVLRYEYGKYQFSAQHPMYMELLPGALKFRYLIFDGKYCYDETYRRGDFEPVERIAEAFYRYLDGAGLMDIYKDKWEVKQ